jgi:oxygen-dependent protoporphyrinogen oxidase
MIDTASRLEVAIVGAGLAGMTAAYELKDRDLVVIEARDRVGGRTLSGEHNGYWYNAGAQYVWDPRTLGLCAELGLEVMAPTGARTAIFIRDRLVVASNPYALLLRMPLSLAEKVRFAATITRLRRLAARRRGFDPELDAKTLDEVLGRVSPATREILAVVTESGTGISLDEVSGAVGLGYAIHLFGGNVNETLRVVRGGTQRITQAMAEAVGRERILLDSVVESIESHDDRVAIRFRRGGSIEEIEADLCIVATTADVLDGVVHGLPQEKRSATASMVPYSKIVSVAWLTDEQRPMPWDRLLTVPALGLSFDLFSHSGFFARSLERNGRRPGGVFVTLASGPRADALWELEDEALATRLREDLVRMFPQARDVIDGAAWRIKRWHGLPRFPKHWLLRQAALREPYGRIYFCGDYTSQPGTPGAVNSGYHTARSIGDALSDGGARMARAAT